MIMMMTITVVSPMPGHLSHREPPELVMMGGKLEPQNLSMRGE